MPFKINADSERNLNCAPENPTEEVKQEITSRTIPSLEPIDKCDQFDFKAFRAMLEQKSNKAAEKVVVNLDDHYRQQRKKKRQDLEKKSEAQSMMHSYHSRSSRSRGGNSYFDLKSEDSDRAGIDFFHQKQQFDTTPITKKKLNASVADVSSMEKHTRQPYNVDTNEGGDSTGVIVDAYENISSKALSNYTNPKNQISEFNHVGAQTLGVDGGFLPVVSSEEEARQIDESKLKANEEPKVDLGIPISTDQDLPDDQQPSIPSNIEHENITRDEGSLVMEVDGSLLTVVSSHEVESEEIDDGKPNFFDEPAVDNDIYSDGDLPDDQQQSILPSNTEHENITQDEGSLVLQEDGLETDDVLLTVVSSHEVESDEIDDGPSEAKGPSVDHDMPIPADGDLPDDKESPCLPHVNREETTQQGEGSAVLKEDGLEIDEDLQLLVSTDEAISHLYNDGQSMTKQPSVYVDLPDDGDLPDDQQSSKLSHVDHEITGRSPPLQEVGLEMDKRFQVQMPLEAPESKENNEIKSFTEDGAADHGMNIHVEVEESVADAVRRSPAKDVDCPINSHNTQSTEYSDEVNDLIINSDRSNEDIGFEITRGETYTTIIVSDDEESIEVKDSFVANTVENGPNDNILSGTVDGFDEAAPKIDTLVEGSDFLEDTLSTPEAHLQNNSLFDLSIKNRSSEEVDISKIPKWKHLGVPPQREYLKIFSCCGYPYHES